MLVKIANYIGFRLYRRFYLIWSPRDIIGESAKNLVGTDLVGSRVVCVLYKNVPPPSTHGTFLRVNLAPRTIRLEVAFWSPFFAKYPLGWGDCYEGSIGQGFFFFFQD